MPTLPVVFHDEWTGTPQLSTVEQTMGVECNVMSESKSADYSRLLKMAT